MKSCVALLFNPFENDRLCFRSVEGTSVSFNSWIEVKKDQAIMIIEPFDLMLASAPEVASGAATAASAAAAAAMGTKLGLKECIETIRQTTKELKETGKIKGFKALVATENGASLVWISMYDIETLKTENDKISQISA